MPDEIKCEIIELHTKTGVCIGSAKCQKGETYILTGRTPEPVGMCGRAYAAIHPMGFSMRWSEKMPFEKDGHVDVTCPDGCVVYRLSRIKR